LFAISLKLATTKSCEGAGLLSLIAVEEFNMPPLFVFRNGGR